jgi:hypothetical protein
MIRKHSAIAEGVAKLEKLNATSKIAAALRNVLDMLDQIEKRLSAVEREDERLRLNREAAKKFFGRR